MFRSSNCGLKDYHPATHSASIASGIGHKMEKTSHKIHNFAANHKSLNGTFRCFENRFAVLFIVVVVSTSFNELTDGWSCAVIPAYEKFFYFRIRWNCCLNADFCDFPIGKGIDVYGNQIPSLKKKREIEKRKTNQKMIHEHMHWKELKFYRMCFLFGLCWQLENGFHFIMFGELRAMKSRWINQTSSRIQTTLWITQFHSFFPNSNCACTDACQSNTEIYEPCYTISIWQQFLH